MNKKKLYLHIGTHKTGTTAIQVFSAKNSDYLKENDCLYVETGRPVRENRKLVGHHLLPWYLIKHNVPKSYYGKYEKNIEHLFSDLVDEIKTSKYNHILISSEEFDKLNSEEIEALKKYFADFEVFIIIYLRRKDSYIESMYQTDVVYNSFNKTIYEFMNETKIPLKYFDFVNKWQKVFGTKNVTVNVYCKKLLKDENVVVDFFNHLGIEVAHKISKGKPSKVNASIPFQYVSLIALLRKLGSDKKIIDTVINIAKSIGSKADDSFHFLSLQERKELVSSGYEEIEQLGIELEDTKCFSLEDTELKQTAPKIKYDGLYKVLKDFENIIK